MKSGMKKAVEYFENMGMPIKNGLIDSANLTERQLETIKDWETKTNIDGIMMPQIEDFYRAILVAISLNPQKEENGEIKYLFGKGIGIEIALRGNVQSRKIYETNPEYRSHSDFELYDAKDEIYTKYFQEVFGSQEYYPPTRTKGLKGIPEGEMDDTHEVVNLDGYEILIPKLELLFLDKFLKKESTPRKSGYDCDLLAERYDLDKNLIFEYLEKYYFKHVIDDERKNEESTRKGLTGQIMKNLRLEIRNGNATNIGEAIKSLNERITEMKKIDDQIISNGISVSTYTPLTQQDILMDEQGKLTLTQEYIEKAMNLISREEGSTVENERNNILGQLNDLFKRTDNNKMKLDKENHYGYKFSEQEIGEHTISIPTIKKDAAKNKLQMDVQKMTKEENLNHEEEK